MADRPRVGRDPFDFDDVAIEGEIVKPAAQILLSGPVRGGASADEARARIARAEAAVAAAGPNGRAAALLELGDAHAALSSALQIEAWAAADEASAAGAWVDPDLSGAEPPLREALRAWDAALAEDALVAPADGSDAPALRPALLERRAWALQELRRDADAVTTWQRLAAEHPGTPEARRAELALAESYFFAGTLDAAARLYERVAAQRDDVGAYAAYKLAWCRYNLGASSEAVEGLVGLQTHPGATDMLRHEAGRDAVLVASALPVADALGVIGRLCGADAACATEHRERLAELYRDAGKLGEAQAVRSPPDAPPAAPTTPRPTRGGRR